MWTFWQLEQVARSDRSGPGRLPPSSSPTTHIEGRSVAQVCSVSSQSLSVPGRSPGWGRKNEVRYARYQRRHESDPLVHDYSLTGLFVRALWNAHRHCPSIFLDVSLSIVLLRHVFVFHRQEGQKAPAVASQPAYGGTL